MGVNVEQGWGMTETSPIVTYNSPTPATADAHRRRRGSPATEAGPRRLRHGREDRRRGGARTAVGRQGVRRLPGARPLGVPRISQSRRGGRGGFRGLVADRRRLHHRPRRLRRDRRSLQGRHQVGRRVDQFDRARKYRRLASRRRRGGDHRRSPPKMAGASVAARRAPRGNANRQGGTARPCSPARSRSGGFPTMCSRSRSCRIPRPASSTSSPCARATRTT